MKKVCAFYASDYHFEMISLPYISEKLEKNNEIVILTENNLEETVKKLLSKINLKEEKKQDILKINWKNNNEEKIQKIQEKADEGKKTIIFIKGKEKYINNMNKNLKEIVPETSKTKIIDCYNIDEIGKNFTKITSQYNKILNTTGEKEIEKL